MRIRLVLMAVATAAFVAPAAAGTVSTPNIAGGLGTILAPPSSPVIVGGVGSNAGNAGGAPSGGSAFVSGFVSAYGGGSGSATTTTNANPNE